MTDPTPMDEGRRRTPISDGVANAMVRFGAARQCPGCQFGIPKYPGRYPRFCPRCGDELQMPKEEKARKANESLDEGDVAFSAAPSNIKSLMKSTEKVSDTIRRLEAERKDLISHVAHSQSPLVFGLARDIEMLKAFLDPPSFGGRIKSEDIRPGFWFYRIDMDGEPQFSRVLRQTGGGWGVQYYRTNPRGKPKPSSRSTYRAQDILSGPYKSVPLDLVKKYKLDTVPSVVEAIEAPVVCTSRAVRIQAIIESGKPSFASYLNDLSCSRAVSVPFATLTEHGGAKGVQAFFEGPVNGLYYRIEEREDPVIVADFDNKNAKMRMFATRDPSRYLGTDPREDIVVEDHEGTFEEPLTEGILKDVADKALGFLSARLAKLWKMFPTLKAVNAVWIEAQRTSGIKLPLTPTLRIARGLDDEMSTALGGLKEGWTPKKPPEPAPLTEAVTVLSVLGFALAIVGGMPLLFRGIAKAAKWLGYPAIQRAFARAAHVAHSIEQGIIDFAIPAELSYALYMAMWKRGWHLSAALGRPHARKLEGSAPLSFEEYLTDPEFQSTIETGMWRLMLLFFFLNGAMHILAAPLGLLFAGDAAATSVKGVELGQGLQRAMVFARTQGPRLARAAMESVNPENVRMIEMGPPDAQRTAAMQLFVSEADARTAAKRLGLALSPKLAGESLYALVHEATGYALGKGEAARLEEYFAQDRARQRIADQGHTRVAGEFHEDKRASAQRQRKPGEGPTQIRGGFRIHVGANQKRTPRKDAEKALQNKMNAKRGLRARITGAKKWHRSREGKKLHAVLGNYNRESQDADAALRAKIVDTQGRIMRYSAGQQRQPVVRLGEAEDNRMTATVRGPSALDNPLPDDHLEAILRRLIVTQNMDVLQDVEFDDDTGSLYLFFDPVLTADEVQEVLAAIKQERGEIQLIASPDMSLPGESVESEWWVLFLPGPNETAIPDPSVYARNPEDYATKVQAVVMAQPNAPEAVAQGLDVGKMMNAAGS